MFKIKARERARLRLFGDIHVQIANAMTDRADDKSKISRKYICDVLGWDKASLSRKLKHSANMTLETISDLAYAMDRDVVIILAPSEHAASIRSLAEACVLGKSQLIQSVQAETNVTFMTADSKKNLLNNNIVTKTRSTIIKTSPLICDFSIMHSRDA